MPGAQGSFPQREQALVKGKEWAADEKARQGTTRHSELLCAVRRT